MLVTQMARFSLSDPVPFRRKSLRQRPPLGEKYMGKISFFAPLNGKFQFSLSNFVNTSRMDSWEWTKKI